MAAAVWVEVEHLVTGRRCLAEYIEDRGELWIGGALVLLREYWAVAELAQVEDPRSSCLLCELETCYACAQEGRSA